MAPSFDDDDQYGLSSADEADMLALVDAPAQGTKRKSQSDDQPPAKRTAVELTSFPCAAAVLKKTFGFPGFQLKQEAVITRILSGESAAVVFPTGGGKSLCFQIPGLVFSEVDKQASIRGDGESGITLVVSPLIALMKDQVDALLRRGIKAATLDSTKSREEYLQTCQMLRDGELKLLYCAPERLNNEGFVEQMKYVRGGIRLLAVDEAHCISEWGHAFRPDYLKIARFVQEINAERVICLTATATPRVAQDICNAFGINPDAGLFRTTTYRPNLRLLAESGMTKELLYPRLFAFLKNNPGPSIVYVTLQKHTDQLAHRLKSEGFKAAAFHAGMDVATKTQLQDQFMKSKDMIMVATIAFGMGIDKANIRNVAHFNIPSSLESYSQEIGRAGRDGKTSNCMFYVCGEDLHLREMFARGDLSSIDSVRDLLLDIFDVDTVKIGVGGDFRCNHYSQERDFDLRSTTLKNIYAQLELTHGLIRATTPIYTKYTYKATKAYTSKMKSDKCPASQAIASHAKFGKSLYTIDVDQAVAKTGTPRADIIHQLNSLSEKGLIDLKPSGVWNVYKVCKALPKKAVEIDKLTHAIYAVMEEREKQSLARTDEMLDLITGKTCFTRALAQHFGDDLPHGKIECGHCTWCLTHKAVVQEIPPPVKFNTVAFNSILSQVADRDDPRLLTKIAFGISSPRITGLKLSRSHLMGSMEDHAFTDLLKAFTLECNKANGV